MQNKSIRQKFNETRDEHEHMIKTIKILIIVGLIIMASMVRYTDFIKHDNGKLFGLEMLTYICCTLAACIFLYYIRNQSLFSFNFIQFIMTAMIFTVIVVACAEISGMNTKFVVEEQEDTSPFQSTPTPSDESEYRKRAIHVKKYLFEKIMLSINLLFFMVIAISFVHAFLMKKYLAHQTKRKDYHSTPYLIILIVSLLVYVASIRVTQVHKFKTYLDEHEWLPKESKLNEGDVGVSVFFTLIFSIFTIIVLITSLFRYDSFKIYSYFPDNPNMCKIKRALATVFLFIIESLLVAAMFAVPVFYVASNRNKPELGSKYKLIKEKEVFIDFGLLVFKIFIFLVALQMTGFYDSYNMGFCRKNGCNVRITSDQVCVPS